MTSEIRKVKIDMKKYIDQCITLFKKEEAEVKLKQVRTLAADSLFKTHEDSESFSNPKAGTFHSMVAKMSCVAKRARPNILLMVSFITTTVKCPNIDD
jgi:hypothetical protein